MKNNLTFAQKRKIVKAIQDYGRSPYSSRIFSKDTNYHFKRGLLAGLDIFRKEIYLKSNLETVLEVIYTACKKLEQQDSTNTQYISEIKNIIKILS